MPWEIKQNYGGCSGYAVVKEGTTEVEGCHSSRPAAQRQMAALYASESEKAVITNETTPNKYPQPVRAKRKKRFNDYRVVNKAENLYDLLVPQEKAFHDSLVRIAEEYGAFDQASSGVWVGYETASENEDAEIGVKCGNCSFHYDKPEGAMGCKLLSYEVEENAKCRLAAIPDGLVNTEMDDDMDDIDMEDMMDDMDKADSVRVGQMVSWNSSGGRATGKVVRIIRDGKYNVPDSDFTITGTPDAPAAVIRLYRDGKPTDTMVGHKVGTLRAMGKSIESIDLIKETISSWDKEDAVEILPDIETDSSHKVEVPDSLSAIFSSMPTHAKRSNSKGDSPLSLNIFKDKENGRRYL
jgi:hypothetical protein